MSIHSKAKESSAGCAWGTGVHVAAGRHVAIGMCWLLNPVLSWNLDNARPGLGVHWDAYLSPRRSPHRLHMQKSQ